MECRHQLRADTLYTVDDFIDGASSVYSVYWIIRDILFSLLPYFKIFYWQWFESNQKKFRDKLYK